MRIYSYLSVAIIFLIAILIQTHMLINWDVSFLMHASQRFLAGGDYLHQFFETNPPMIIYIYTLPVMFAKLFSLGFPQALLIFILSLVVLSLYLCNFLLKNIFTTEKKITEIILPVLAIIFLILPLYEFGQREHLLTIFVIPYLFLCVLRLQEKAIDPYFASIVGLLAGLGFVIKPYFVLPLILVECYLWIARKKIWGWYRPEIIAILLVYLSYIISVFLIFPEYINTVIPLLLKLYYAGFSYPYQVLILQGAFIYVALVFFVSLFFLRVEYHRYLYTVFSIATFGFAVIYLQERTNWFYHLLPAMSVAILLSVLIFILYFIPRKNYLLIIAAALVLLFYPVKGMIYVTGYMLNKDNDRPRLELLAFLQKQPAANCYFLSTNGYAFPILEYTQQVAVSRFANYWWLPGILALSNSVHDVQQQHELDSLKNYFIDMVVDDLVKKKPRWILVDNRPKNTELHAKNIDYVALFSENASFKKIWKNYQYQFDVGYYHIYKRLSSVVA